MLGNALGPGCMYVCVCVYIKVCSGEGSKANAYVKYITFLMMKTMKEHVGLLISFFKTIKIGYSGKISLER